LLDASHAEAWKSRRSTLDFTQSAEDFRRPQVDRASDGTPTSGWLSEHPSARRMISHRVIDAHSFAGLDSLPIHALRPHVLPGPRTTLARARRRDD
jgi:hypothetical protein